MTTYREMVYMVLDLIKASNDDFYYNEDHIIFLLDKYRAFLLKLKYSDMKRQVPQSNFLNIKITEITKNNIPNILNIALPQYKTRDNKKFNYCSPNRFEYVGISEWNKKSNYFTLLLYGDKLQLLTSTENKNTNTFNSKLNVSEVHPIPVILNEDRISNKNLIRDVHLPYVENYLTAVFESPKVVYELEGEDILDKTFPLEEGLISSLLELMNKDLSTAMVRPQDTINDSLDNLGELTRMQAMAQNNRKQ